jgi:HAD superfamily hydrolase (TIGR01509 family)
MSRTKKGSLQGVLFDWDGTLVDSYEADSAAYLAMFREMGIAWGLEDLAEHYSPNWYDVYRAAKLAEARWKDADQCWRKHYAKHAPQLVAGAREVLDALRPEHHLGLVTSGDRVRVTRQLREFGLTRFFRARVCGGDTRMKKPHPAPLRMALRCMSLKPSTCVYVGDSPEDLQMARSAGVRAIAVLGCFPTEKRLRAAKPEYLLESIRELPTVLQKMKDEVRKTEAAQQFTRL